MAQTKNHILRAFAVLGMVSYATIAQAQTTQREPAQEEGEPAADEIVVTGFLGSLNEGTRIKRDSVQFVDVIVADDIGKLPDTNVAESLQRVSGVQLTRGIGEGSDVTIRGLRQNLTLLNGRTLNNSSGRGGNGPDTLETSTYGTLAQIPSELIARLEVAKQAGADEIEGALGGVINIVTRKPLDDPGFHIAGTVTGIYSELADSFDPKVFGLISDSFAGDTFGVQLSVLYSDRNIREDGFNSFTGFLPLTAAFNGNGSGVTFDPNGDGRPGSRIADFRYQQIDDQRERLGVEGVLQWRPTDDVELVYSGLYSRIRSDRDRHWFSIVTSAAGADYPRAVFSPDETLIAGTVLSPLQSNYEISFSESETISNALSASVKSGPVKVSGEIAYTTAKEVADQGFYRLQTPSRFPIAFDFTGGVVPALTFPAGVDLTNPANFVGAVLFDNLFEVETDDLSGRVDFDIETSLGPIKSVELGARYQKLDTVREVDFFQQGGLNIPLSAIPNNFEVFSSPDFLPGPNIPRSYVSWTGRRRCADFNAFYSPAAQAACAANNDPSRSYEIKEDIMAAYAKANFAFELGGIEASGNVGVRYVTRNITSLGSIILGSAITPTRIEDDDDAWLPSAVMRFNLNDNLIARVGAAKVLAFPNTEDLFSTLVLPVNADGTLAADPRTTGGNPRLDPFEITQADGSLEWYFRPGSLLSAGLFYKDVKSFIITSVQNEILPGIAVPIPVSRRINGQGGSIKGIELLFQSQFDFLPSPFDGLGVQATYTYIDSKTPFLDQRTGETLPIPGLSKNNVNLVGIYEKGPFGLRVAYNWRDRYFDSIGVNGGGVFFDSYQDLAVTARFDITKNISVSAEASNLLDTELIRYNSVREALNSTQQYGRVYSVGARVLF